MKPASFGFLKPSTLPEALAFLASHGADGKIIAGGQSLVPSMNFRLARPETLIDINDIPEIQGVRDMPDHLEIGAVTRHAAFHSPVCPGPLGRMLSKVVANIAHYPIRQRGTFGGSLSHADPASEWCLVTAALGGELEIHGQSGPRRVPVTAFFKGTFMTDVGLDEILARIRLPKLPEGWGTGFYEFSRRKGDFALASALAALSVGGGVVRGARLGLGAVAAHPLRLTDCEAALIGQPATAETFARIGAMAQAQVHTTGDIHGSAEYRRELIATVLRRALTEAAEEATR